MGDPDAGRGIHLLVNLPVYSCVVLTLSTYVYVPRYSCNYYDLVSNRVIMMACIMDSEMPYTFSFGHCIMRLVHHKVAILYIS